MTVSASPQNICTCSKTAWLPIRPLAPSLPLVFLTSTSSPFITFLFFLSSSLSPCISPSLSEADRMVSLHSSLHKKGHERLIPLSESACHSLISFNSLIPSFAGGISCLERGQYSLMLSVLKRILFSPWLRVRVPYLA